MPQIIGRQNPARQQRIVRHRLQPDCIVNARVGNRLGDYTVQEQKIPAGGDPKPWETCMTLNDHWGYKKGDEHWKPTEKLLRNLIDIASKGGNFLLNVGPAGEGLIPAGSVEHLRVVSSWMRVNGPAIYGTTASPFPTQPAWGRVTKKATPDGTTLYLHVFDWPADGKLVVPGLQSRPAKAHGWNESRTLVRQTEKPRRFPQKFNDGQRAECYTMLVPMEPIELCQRMPASRHQT